MNDVEALRQEGALFILFTFFFSEFRRVFLKNFSEKFVALASISLLFSGIFPKICIALMQILGVFMFAGLIRSYG
jgi:hypothetical protein